VLEVTNQIAGGRNTHAYAYQWPAIENVSASIRPNLKPNSTVYVGKGFQDKVQELQTVSPEEAIQIDLSQ
jgi:hypothetical protein